MVISYKVEIRIDEIVKLVGTRISVPFKIEKWRTSGGILVCEVEELSEKELDERGVK